MSSKGVGRRLRLSQDEEDFTERERGLGEYSRSFDARCAEPLGLVCSLNSVQDIPDEPNIFLGTRNRAQPPGLIYILSTADNETGRKTRRYGGLMGISQRIMKLLSILYRCAHGNQARDEIIKRAERVPECRDVSGGCAAKKKRNRKIK